MNKTEIYKKLIAKFGVKNQIIVAIEELSELQKELCKTLRGEENKPNICEEIADVEIMLEQIKMLYDINEVVEFEKNNKLKRTNDRYLKIIDIDYPIFKNKIDKF